MAYIGNKADTAFTSLLKQDLTGASGTSLTLTHAVANANDIALYINNVRQEPTTAYSTSGTAVTLTGSVVSSDDIYVIYLARAVQTTVPPDGSVSTAKIASSAVDLTSKVTGVLPVANGGTALNIAIPIFRIFKDGNAQTVPDNTDTKITFSTTSIDTNSLVDLSNNKVVITSATEGYWQLHFQYRTSHAPYRRMARIHINGSVKARFEEGQYSSNTPLNPTSGVTTIIQLSANDYLEAFVYNYYNGSTAKAVIGDSNGVDTYFEGWRIR